MAPILDVLMGVSGFNTSTYCRAFYGIIDLIRILRGVNMEICGEIVKHKIFGRGQIVEFANDYVTVLFDDIKVEKKFIYPSAFGVFLELKNKSFLNEIEEDKNIIAKEEAENIRVKEELAKLAVTIKSKVSRVKSIKKTTEKIAKVPKPKIK